MLNLITYKNIKFIYLTIYSTVFSNKLYNQINKMNSCIIHKQ